MPLMRLTVKSGVYLVVIENEKEAEIAMEQIINECMEMEVQIDGEWCNAKDKDDQA